MPTTLFSRTARSSRPKLIKTFLPTGGAEGRAQEERGGDESKKGARGLFYARVKDALRELLHGGMREVRLEKLRPAGKAAGRGSGKDYIMGSPPGAARLLTGEICSL